MRTPRKRFLWQYEPPSLTALLKEALKTGESRGRGPGRRLSQSRDIRGPRRPWAGSSRSRSLRAASRRGL
jgi:hypothetical protein